MSKKITTGIIIFIMFFSIFSTKNTQAAVETLETLSATDITDVGAILRGKVNVQFGTTGTFLTWFKYIKSETIPTGSVLENWSTTSLKGATTIGEKSETLVGLESNKKYYYSFCVSSANTSGLFITITTTCGKIVPFTTIDSDSYNSVILYPGASGSGNNNSDGYVSTYNPTEIKEGGARLNGSIKASNSFPSTDTVNVYFRYSTLGDFPPVFCNDIYGSNMKSTKEIKLNPTSSGVAFYTNLSGLENDTQYYYCAIVSNKKNIAYGEVRSFATLPDQSISVQTQNPLVASKTSAHLNGFYNTALPAETWFEYRKVNTSPVITEKVNANKNTNNGFSALDISGVKDGQDSAIQKTNIIDPSIQKDFSIQKTTSNTGTANEFAWNKKAVQSFNQNTSGKFSHLLTGLSPNATYMYHAVAKSSNGAYIKYGDDITFSTKNSTGTGTDSGDYGSNTTNSNYKNNTTNNNYQNNTTLTLGQTATAPDYALVHYREGIETVLARQIVNNPDLAEAYGYKEGNSLQNFAWTLAHNLAKTFGYVSSTGKEIRVSPVDRAAYELRLENGYATVYEYLDSKIVNIQKASSVLRNKYGYEYYFKKK